MSGDKAAIIRASKIDITPTWPVPLFGRVGRVNHAVKIASHLEANCLLVSTHQQTIHAALVTIDSLYPSQKLVDAVSHLCLEAGLELPPERILIVASHTHNAPALDDTKPLLGLCDPKYVNFVSRLIADCLISLVSCNGARVSRFFYGSARAKGAVYRRKAVKGFDFSRLRFEKRTMMAPNYNKKIDETLTAVILSDCYNNPVAVLWTWPCHAVSESEPQVISSDFPGIVRAHVRATLADENLVVQYFPGFSGDVRPRSHSWLPIHKSGTWVGTAPRFDDFRSSDVEKLRIELRSAFDKAYARREKLCQANDIEFSTVRRGVAISDIRTEEQGHTSITCDEWRIGPVRIKAVSAEVASDYRNASIDKSVVLLTGCAGQVFGYIPTDSQLPFGGYEVEGFSAAFSISGSFRTEIGERIIDLIGQ